jgi:hypothetical protein
MPVWLSKQNGFGPTFFFVALFAEASKSTAQPNNTCQKGV